MSTRIRPPFKLFGGKYYMVKHLLPLIGATEIYVEPYGGAGSVLLNKEPSRLEVYNDIDERLFELFTVLKCEPQEFTRQLSLTLYSEKIFEDAKESEKSNTIERAVSTYVEFRQSISGMGESWSYSLQRSRAGMADVVSGWLSSIDENLPKVIERFRTIQIEHDLATDIIQKYDVENVFYYSAPPYLPETRAKGARKVYRHEMTKEEHEVLADVLGKIRGRFLLSGYQSELYEALYGKPQRVFELPNNSATGSTKQRRLEAVWANYEF